MTYAAITGWGKCLPPAVLTNQDLSTILDTSDEWIVSRTGIRERRISHVGLEELAYVAAMRALAAAGIDGRSIELIVFGTCSHDDQVPNMASGDPGAHRRAAGRCVRHQHRLHQLPLRPLDGHGADPHRGGEECARDRRRAHLPVHGLERPRRRGAVRRRRRRGGARGERARRKACSPRSSAASARRARSCASQGMGGRYANRGMLYGVTRWQFRGTGDLQARRHGHGERLRGHPRTAAAHARGCRPGWCRTRRICASSRPSPSARRCRWSGCS